MTQTPADAARRERRPDHDVDAILYERWSPRAMSGESVTQDELDRIFEAARWAPSSYNRQPWRFFYALRGDAYWNDFLGLLTAGNRSWAQNASALIVIASRKTLEDGTESRTHSFDTGAAWQNLALQGTRMGLVVHGMEGFAYEKSRTVLGLPPELEVEAMCVIGRYGAKEDLPEKYRPREAPRDRAPIDAFVRHGRFEPPNSFRK